MSYLCSFPMQGFKIWYVHLTLVEASFQGFSVHMEPVSTITLQRPQAGPLCSLAVAPCVCGSWIGEGHSRGPRVLPAEVGETPTVVQNRARWPLMTSRLV